MLACRKAIFGATCPAKLTVIVIITHDDLFGLAILAHLAPEVFVKGIEMILKLTGVHLIFGIICRILVEIGKENRLRIRRFNMLSRATITVAACANFVVKGAIDFILFSSEDGGKVISHIGWLDRSREWRCRTCNLS